MSGFNGLKATSTRIIAPFSEPYGLNIGEAAAFWVVEDMEQAMLRHAPIKGKIAGHGLSCDAYHPTAPDPRGDGVYKTLTFALADSGLTIADIGCVNAHGTGTEANDRAESRGIAKFFGQTPVPVTSTKSFFGHCMGTTGMLEATCNLLAMNAGFIPPTLNFSAPRPGCSLDYVPNASREKIYSAFISANYAFGGNNAAVVITKWDKPTSKPRPSQGRVVLTGFGMVSALGLGVEATLDALRKGTIGLSTVERLGLPPLRSKKAGLVPSFKPLDIDRRCDFTGMNTISKFATAASRLALDRARLRVGPKNADSVGICMGVCNGPPESDHMNSVFASDTFAPDINNFSSITANSTAGGVSNALCLKGVNMTLANGPHAGLQCIAYAYSALREGRAQAIIAAASDEVYAQTYFNYDLIGFLHRGDDEDRYRCNAIHDKRKVIGEGAVSVVVETLENAHVRGADIMAEVLGYGLSADALEFSAPSLGTEGLTHACETALDRSGLTWGDIGCIVWAPQGNRQDEKILSVLKAGLGTAYSGVPLITTTFNTGFIETASIAVSLACALECLKNGKALWPQITGISDIDSRTLKDVPQYLLALASTDLGYNFALIVKTGRFILP